MKTTLIFVRHGESESNRAKRFTGQMDIPLTELGRKQAQKTADYLRSVPLTAIYSSDLCRAMQTAEPTARIHGLPIRPDAELRELHCGKWEGVAYDTVAELYPEDMATWNDHFGNARPTGGESIPELADRVSRAVEKIVRENVGGCVAVFGHGAGLRVLRCRWLGLPLSESANRANWAANASVSMVEYDEAFRPELRLFGYDEHLAGMSTTLTTKI